MTIQIAQQRCKHHPSREAAVRCPSCGYFYCSECCIDYDGRLLCAPCLEKLKCRSAAGRYTFLRRILPVLAGGGAFILLWFIYFVIGDLLLLIPDEWLDTVKSTNEIVEQR